MSQNNDAKCVHVSAPLIRDVIRRTDIKYYMNITPDKSHLDKLPPLLKKDLVENLCTCNEVLKHDVPYPLDYVQQKGCVNLKKG